MTPGAGPKAGAAGTALRSSASLRSTSRRAGFTLIELLVVIAVVSVLVAIVTPSLRHALVLARRGICASNLHQWGLGISTYAAENGGQLMRTSIHPLTGCVGPEIVRVQPTGHGEWCAAGIDPFVDAFDLPRQHVQGIGICPDVDTKFFEFLSNAHWQSDRNYTQLTYSYFARVDQWPEHAINGAQDDLTGRHPSMSRLLMSDVLMLDGNTLRFRYNHSRFGWVWNWQDYGHLADYGPPQASGLNQLDGGGGVRWKPAGGLDLEHMAELSTYRDGWVHRSSPSGAMFY